MSASIQIEEHSRRELVLGMALLLAFLPGVRFLAGIWSSVEYLNHGFLVPLVSLWLWMRERPRRDARPVAEDPRMAPLVALSLLAYVAGLLASVPWLTGLGMVAAIAAGLAWMRGGAWLAGSPFPVAFLVFMVPPPNGWVTPLIVSLQLWVSAVAVEVLYWVGATVLREGNILHLADGGQLFVAEACSGVTSLITLATLGVLLGHLSLERRRSRLLLLVAVIPVAMLANLTRVLVTVWIADRFGVVAATEGPPHTLLGLLAYVLGVGMMLGVDALLRRRERTPS